MECTRDFRCLLVLPRRGVRLDAAAERLLASMGELLTDLTLKNARALPDIRPSIDTLSEGTSPHTHRPRWASEENNL